MIISVAAAAVDAFPTIPTGRAVARRPSRDHYATIADSFVEVAPLAENVRAEC